MNKKQVKRIKQAMSYADTPQQKKVLRQIKKQFSEVPHNQKETFLVEVEEFFKLKEDK